MHEAEETTPSPEPVLEFGGYRINLNTYELLSGERPVAMEPQVFSLLAYLVVNRDRLVTKDELLDELWGHRYVSESALSTQIKSLRCVITQTCRRSGKTKSVSSRPIALPIISG